MRFFFRILIANQVTSIAKISLATRLIMAEKPIKKSSKLRITKPSRNVEDKNIICNQHNFKASDISTIQKNLLQWYDKFHRVLPWRTIAKSETDENIRGYAVWVSEIMCQQTQVATVIPYYNRWMQKWPSVQDLSTAKLEEVNQVWSGLGYYSRARRLSEGSKVIVDTLNGQIPQSVEELMKLIPGIGRYTASAISSVAYQQVAGVVDGNVARVLSRMKVIGSEISKPVTQKHLWNLANEIVSIERPGDFNQAFMELGALICSPRNPKCSECPVNVCCSAYLMVKENSQSNSLDGYLKDSSKTKKGKGVPEVCDIENVLDCQLCLSPIKGKESFEVTTFPCKAKKKSSRNERIGVVVIEKQDQILMSQRPDTGLLAGLWEFPSTMLDSEASVKEQKDVVNDMLASIGVTADQSKLRKYISEVVHIFSHINTTYVVEHLVLKKPLEVKSEFHQSKWMTKEEISSAAVSTAMKKVLAAVNNDGNSPNSKKASKKRKIEDSNSSSSKQPSIKSFFK